MYMILPSSPCTESRHRHVSCACIHAYMEVDKDRPGSTHTGRWCEKKSSFYKSYPQKEGLHKRSLVFPHWACDASHCDDQKLVGEFWPCWKHLGSFGNKVPGFIAANIQIKLVLHGILPESWLDHSVWCPREVIVNDSVSFAFIRSIGLMSLCSPIMVP